jgi:hypothetical protein
MVNAFWLDADVDQTARWLVDRHVTSSVFECSMVLTTAAQERGYPDEADDLYFTHANHPLTRWAGSSYANWRRLYAYTDAAHDEWRYRYDHAPDEYHGSWATVRRLDDDAVEALNWPAADATEPPQVTGEWTAAATVDAYRLYYANEKRHLFEWSAGRTPPAWVDEYTFPGGPGSHPY